jgi:hypothetical protein
MIPLTHSIIETKKIINSIFIPIYFAHVFHSAGCIWLQLIVQKSKYLPYYFKHCFSLKKDTPYCIFMQNLTIFSWNIYTIELKSHLKIKFAMFMFIFPHCKWNIVHATGISDCPEQFSGPPSKQFNTQKRVLSSCFEP